MVIQLKNFEVESKWEREEIEQRKGARRRGRESIRMVRGQGSRKKRKRETGGEKLSKQEKQQKKQKEKETAKEKTEKKIYRSGIETEEESWRS